MRACDTGGENSGCGRLNGHDLNIRILGLQVFTDTGDCAARADACHKDVHLSIGVLIDLRAGALPMCLGVGWVCKLAGDKAVLNLCGKFFRLGDGAFHSFGTFRQHKLSAVSLHQLAALHTHGLRHDDDDPVASRCRHRGKADAGVARGGFDDDRTGLELSAGFRVVDHCLSDAVLHGTGRVKIFQFGEDFRLQAVLFFYMGQLQKRSLTDQLVGGCVNGGHILIPPIIQFDFALMRLSVLTASLVPALWNICTRIISNMTAAIMIRYLYR